MNCYHCEQPLNVYGIPSITVYELVNGAYEWFHEDCHEQVRDAWYDQQRSAIETYYEMRSERYREKGQ